MREHPRWEPCALTLSTYADEMVIHVTGPEAAAVADMADVTRTTLDELEGALSMEVSRCRKPWTTDKKSRSIGVGSSKSARARLEPALRAVGMRTARRVNNLGNDFPRGENFAE